MTIFCSTRRKERRKRKDQEIRVQIQIGDSVLVKPGISDPDFGIDIGGWQGRICEIEAPEGGDAQVCIEWDSLTLTSMPDALIEKSEEQGLDWTKMYFDAHEVELTKPRDTKGDVSQAVEGLATNYAWYHLGEPGRRVRKVLIGVDAENEMAALSAWERHLSAHLTFPFEAQVVERDRGPLRLGDRVTVERISGVEDLYGIIVSLRRGRRRYDALLCDLEVIDKDSPNYQVVKDYVIWFANR